MRRSLSAATAAAAIGELEPGCEVFGLTKGQFSLIDVIQHCLEASGPAEVLLSTWTAAGSDIDHALKLVSDGRIMAMRFVVDFSFPTRQPAYCAALRQRFGDAAIRVTKVHSKFCVIRNQHWSLVIRSSMNLNENRRMESFEVSDDAAMADYIEAVLGELFTEIPPGVQFERGASENAKTLDRLGEAAPAVDYFGDGPHDRDLRRSGWTGSKSGKAI